MYLLHYVTHWHIRKDTQVAGFWCIIILYIMSMMLLQFKPTALLYVCDVDVYIEDT